jgi:hypothetical protein
MSKQSKMLKADILKILSKDVSGGSNTRPAFESAKAPSTFFGGQDNQPYYPLAQEPTPAANPATPIVPKIVTLESGQKSGKRPTYKSAKQPKTFFGGTKEKCAKANQDVVKFCAASKKLKKKRAPSAYNLFIKEFFSKNKGATMKSAAAAWKASKSGVPAPPKAARAAIKLTSFGEVPPPPPPGPPPAKKKKLKIVDRKKPAAAKAPTPAPKPAASKAKAEKKPTFEEFWSKLINEEGFDEEYHADDTNYDRARAAARRDAKKIWKERYPKKAPAPKPAAAPAAKKDSNRMLWKDADIDRTEDFYDARDYIGDNINDSAAYNMDWSDYLTESENNFYRDNYGEQDSLSEKQQSRYERIEGKLRDKMDAASAKIWNKLNKDFVKSIGKKETDTKDGWSMRFFKFVSDAGYDVNRGSDTAEYYKKKRGGRVRHPGKPRPKKQLQSFAKKEPSKPRTKKNSAWMAHLAEFRKANPSIAAKDMMKAAKQTYKKGGAHCGGAQNHCNAPPPIDGDQIGVGGAAIKPDIKMVGETHTMPDGTIMPGKTHGGDSKLVKEIMEEKMSGNAPVAPEKLPEKSKQDQKQIMVDIMNSYDTFNKRFEDVSNSSASLENKRSQYNSERDRIDKFHSITLQNFGDTLSDENKRIDDKAYRYALETYKIGLDSLKAGAPQQRVEFENFDDNDTITEIIDKALSVPRTALDRARSFFSVPIKNYPIQTFHPVVPALGRMASAYPYGYQMTEKAMRGGKAKKTPKQMITQLTKDMFVRDMSRKYPKMSKEKIMAAYKKNLGDIRSVVTDAIADAMKIRGGAACGPDEFSSGDRCYKKQARPDNFDRDKFFADQKGEVAARERRDDGFTKQNDAPELKADMSTKRTADAAMPLPAPKPQDKTEKDFFEKFSAAVTPEESGAIFGTDGTDISDPKAWVDTLANIFVGTASGIGTIFDALGSIF